MDLSEHEKLKAIKPLSQAIGNFIEWLGENGMTICSEDRSPYRPPGLAGLVAEVQRVAHPHSGDLQCLFARRAAAAGVGADVLTQFFELFPDH